MSNNHFLQKWFRPLIFTFSAIVTGMAPAPISDHYRGSESFTPKVPPYFKYQSEDGPIACIDPSESEFLISKYKVRLETFPRVKKDMKAELCARDSRIRKLIEALRIIEFAKFSDLPYGFINVPYTEYFLERSTEINASGCPGYGNTAVACHPMSKGPTWLGEMLFHYPAIFIAGTLIHEVRHADGFDHVTCNNAAIGVAQESCDPSYSDGGSFAVQAEFFARIALYGENFHPSLREVARSLALNHVESHFNSPSRLEGRAGFAKINSPIEE